MNFYADDVLQRAEEFLDAQRRLRDQERELGMYWPRYFVFGHAIELALKAYLASAHGIPDDTTMTSRYRTHSLETLLSEATQAGLSLTGDTQDGIRALSQAHEEYWARYVKPGDPVFTLDQFEKNLEELFQVVCRRVRHDDLRKFVNY